MNGTSASAPCGRDAQIRFPLSLNLAPGVVLRMRISAHLRLPARREEVETALHDRAQPGEVVGGRRREKEPREAIEQVADAVELRGAVFSARQQIVDFELRGRKAAHPSLLRAQLALCARVLADHAT